METSFCNENAHSVNFSICFSFPNFHSLDMKKSMTDSEDFFLENILFTDVVGCCNQKMSVAWIFLMKV